MLCALEALQLYTLKCMPCLIEQEEIQFWRRLPATLAAASRQAGVACRHVDEPGEGVQLQQRPLWEGSVAIGEARERVVWHQEAADKDHAPSAHMQVPSHSCQTCGGWMYEVGPQAVPPVCVPALIC